MSLTLVNGLIISCSLLFVFNELSLRDWLTGAQVFQATKAIANTKKLAAIFIVSCGILCQFQLIIDEFMDFSALVNMASFK